MTDQAVRPASRQLDQLLEELNSLLGSRVSVSADVRRQHGTDESYHEPTPPDAVVFPENTEEVSQIVALCSKYKMPVIPFGTGTSLEGHVAALHGGISIDMRGMNRILSVNVDDLDATVEAGVTRKELNEALKHEGLFFPIDPGADASLGGMAATRASGTTTVLYGGMRENVLSLKVVLADGRVIRTSSRARKSSAGYDLTRLFVGSEGTLGVICELTIRLRGIPEAISAAVCSFDTIEQAVGCVIQIIQLGIPIARSELVDEVMMEGFRKFSGLDYPITPTLFLEFHGSEVGVVDQAKAASEVAAEFGGSEFKWATKHEDRTTLWQARHDALYASLALRPGSKAFITDVCVPISTLAVCLSDTKKDINESYLIAPIVGHVGDGNFHIAFVIDPEKQDELAEARRLNKRLVDRALALGGTCTGEHGIGSGKIEAAEAEHGEAIEVMRSIKRALDPDGLMNPGKVLRPTP
jgi:D-lactate dehydrogenase (cytochrome)